MNIAAQMADHLSARPVRDIRRGINKLREAFETSNPFRIAFQYRTDFCHRTEKHFHQQQEPHESAVSQLIINHVPGSGDHHDQLNQTRTQIAQRQAGSHDLIGFQFRRAVIIVVRSKQFLLMRFVSEGFHHTNAADAFFYTCVKITHLAEQAPPGFSHLRTVAADHPGHRGHNNDGHQRQLDMHRRHQNERADKGHHRDKYILRPVVCHFAHFLQILGDMGNDVTGFGIVVITE
ncbi:hypothetical protein SRABI106_04718 [Rahnella aquatilis]|nr:hypothetical protein SRABI106_04718 [Rahnella aquatilis]